LQDLELTRGETSRIALESQPIPFAKRGNPFAKRREADRGGYLVALIEQCRRLRPVVASAGVQQRGSVIVTRPRELGLETACSTERQRCLEVGPCAALLAGCVSEETEHAPRC
jgi:hypothetical protein